MTTVTTRCRECRIAHTPPAVSASFISAPPWTLPRGLASSGNITWASVSSSVLARWVTIELSGLLAIGCARARATCCLIVQKRDGPREDRVRARGDIGAVGLDDLVGHDTDFVQPLAVGGK